MALIRELLNDKDTMSRLNDNERQTLMQISQCHHDDFTSPRKRYGVCYNDYTVPKNIHTSPTDGQRKFVSVNIFCHLLRRFSVQDESTGSILSPSDISYDNTEDDLVRLTFTLMFCFSVKYATITGVL